MDKEIVLDVLTVRDHQAALAIINWLNSCQNKDEFNQVLETAILPLMACNGAFYGQIAPEQNALQLLGSINQSTCCQPGWQRFIKVAIHKLASTEEAATANTNFQAQIKTLFCCSDPATQPPIIQPCQQSHRYCTTVSISDDHEKTHQFYFCRLNKTQQEYNKRDIALLEMLRSTLMQTLRLIQFREENLNTQQIIDFWSDHTEPVAVIRNDGTTLFQSHAFEQIIKQDKHAFPATALALIKTIQRKQIAWHSFLSKLGRRLYEIRLTQVNADPMNHQNIYLLHLTRITHNIGKIFSQLNRSGLTHREMEIALLIYQGISTREISERIHLSYHTVRNHIKSIYSKLGVSSRSEMLVWVG